MLVCPRCNSLYPSSSLDRCPEDGSLLYVLGSEGASRRAWDIGDTIAEKYELISKLSRRGGAGESWRARQLRLEREVELRILPAGTFQQPGDQARFEREVGAWARLRDRNLARLYDAGLTEHQEPYITLEFSPHGSLGELLSTGHTLPLNEIPVLTETLLSALHAAHASMVLHRDVNPHAVLLYAEPDGSLRYRLTGFGLAKQLDLDDDPTAITMTGQVLGDPAYMAPETIMSGFLEPRTDLYALGVTLFEALTGRRPFVGESLSEMLAAHVQKDPPLLRTLRSEVSQELELFIARLLAKQPEDRFSSAAEALETLKQLPPESFEAEEIPTPTIEFSRRSTSLFSPPRLWQALRDLLRSIRRSRKSVNKKF